MAQDPICQAVNLSDSQPCMAVATSWDNVFCKFHGKQCYGLYSGYKKRNAKLDSLSDGAPAYLRETSIPLANETFEGVTAEKTLKEIHDHIYSEYVLLGQVIDARKLHHKHFYPRQMDYGHQAYLDTLSNRRHIVLRALEKLETRIAQVLYENQRWYKWVREAQRAEEATREKESKKIKREAAMFKRHQAMLKDRLQVQREKEERRRQDAYLDAAYQERMSASADNEDDAETWDPIEDILEDERTRYIDLIKHFLWMEDPTDVDGKAPNSTDISTGMENMTISKKGKRWQSERQRTASVTSDSKPNGHLTASQDRQTGQLRIAEMIMNGDLGEHCDEPPVASNTETELEMRRRLKEGIEKNYDNFDGVLFVGAPETPYATHLKTAPLLDEEIDSLAKDIKEIKLLLFCRLLLSHASLLPAAVRASSVEEFLNDPDIAESDLRDLCLKVETPSLQDIRDACADLTRKDEPEEYDDDEGIVEEESVGDIMSQAKQDSHIQVPMEDATNMKNIRMFLPSGEEKPSKKTSRRKMKVQICGKSVWNYASENSMSRDGWFQFSIMAKDCDLRHAVQLCRNWDEFSQLDYLAFWQYFPASNWVSWGGDVATRTFHQYGFFPYFHDLDLGAHSHKLSRSARSRIRRKQNTVETRNIIAGHMRRDDPATHRFLHSLAMRPEVLVLVRDGRTGRILMTPEKEQMWTMRRKQGPGHASESEWDIQLEVSHQYFKAVQKLRQWHLGFDGYYDVWIWTTRPGGEALYIALVIALRKAWKHTKHDDRFAQNETILRALTRDKKTMRVRSIRPEERVPSLWDEIPRTSAEDASKVVMPNDFYNEADAAEDMVLFPDNPTRPRVGPPSIAGSMVFDMGKVSNLVPINWMEGFREEMHDYLSHMHGGSTDSQINYDYVQRRVFSAYWIHPRIWDKAIAIISRGHIDSERKQLLGRVGLLSEASGAIRSGTAGLLSMSRRAEAQWVNTQMWADGIVVSLHEGDLEPGAQEKHAKTYRMLREIMSRQTGGSTEWVWFLVTILDWLELRADCNNCEKQGMQQPFTLQDMIAAFTLMAPFFPDLEICQPVTDFFESEEGAGYRNSSILKPQERAKTPPDCRSRTSIQHRSSKFWREGKRVWEEWEKAGKAQFNMKTPLSYADLIPMESNVVLRSIIAKLYRAGIIEPQHSDEFAGTATTNTEPHRPDQLDLFIYYSAYLLAPPVIPRGYIEPSEWPVFLPLAKAFALENGGAKFAILRIWSAPHFYPYFSLGRLASSKQTQFVDSETRCWSWNFLPKDFQISEWLAYIEVKERLEPLQKPLKVGDRVVHRNEAILVMGTDELDLLKYVTAVTFAIQTHPWYQEIDLWKSFVNVDLEFLEGLDPYWLD